MTLDMLPYFYNEKTGEVTWQDPRTKDLDEKDEWTWVPHPTEMWVPARIEERKKDGSTLCVTESGMKVTVPKGGDMKGEITNDRKQKVPLWKLNRRDLVHVEDDLVMLENVNDASISYNICERYKNKELYTWVGATQRVLVSVNPYQKLDLYNDEQVKLHHDKSPNKQVSPHVFDVADGAYLQMLYEATNQSILISGESGAGKTEATKQCLKFWAKVAGSKNGVEEKLIEANPVLEAFGNAKTIRNNNSSRFGKWMEVYFSIRDRSIDGANITNFLLEKSRLVFQQAGERNFHIFYQLMNDTESRQKYELGPVTANRYTMKGLTTAVVGLDDAAEFKETKKAMAALGFTAEEQEWLLRTPSAILHLGNCQFLADAKPGGVTGSKIEDEKQAKLAAKFLKVSEDQLKKILLSRTISVRGEVSVIFLDPDAARAGCDSLAKGIYSRLFDWIVARCNKALTGVTTGKVIGVLDIFGFEIFDVNSFEQLCINFCNEKLQQLFNIETFKEEEKLYSEEGITFEPIKFIDSDPVLAMIEKGPDGILPTLDDECKLEGDDHKFMTKIQQTWGSHPNFSVDKHRKFADSLAFEINHYAGIVNYTVSEFKVKNKDTFAQDGYDLGASSVDPLTKSLFPPLDAKMQVKSLSSVFRTQLNVLMEKLKVTSTRYVRCIKPNESMSPMLFEPPLVIRQLRYSGVFEAVAIRKQGFPFRFKYEVFAIRFKCINPHHNYKQTDPKKVVQEIFDASPNFKSLKDQVMFGKTMVLYRAPVHKLLKLLRNLALEIIVPKIKGILRGSIARWLRIYMSNAEKELKAAFDTQTDIGKMREAVSHVDGHLKSLGKNLFPNVRPRWEREVAERIVLLQKCVDEEVKVLKLLETDPNKNFKTWTEQKVQLDVVKDTPKTPSQKETFTKFLTTLANCEVQKLDNKCIDGRKRVDKALMQDCDVKAKEWNHTSPAVVEMRRVLALPEVAFIELEMIAATEMNDMPRLKQRMARLFEAGSAIKLVNFDAGSRSYEVHLNNGAVKCSLSFT